jgi:hypothetical protein
MSISSLPPDLWYEVFGLLDIDGAIAVSKASPRIFGAFIESKQGIRFRNAINSYMRSNAVDLPVGSLSSFICNVMRNSSLEFSSLVSWLAIGFHPVLSSTIVVNKQLGRCEEIFYRNDQEVGIWNHPRIGFVLGVGVGLAILISIYQTIVTRTSVLIAVWVVLRQLSPERVFYEQSGWGVWKRTRAESICVVWASEISSC